MLELWSSEGAFARIEEYLHEAGFFGSAEDLVADVYLGYALSRSLRRTSAPDPPEPCRLPRARTWAPRRAPQRSPASETTCRLPDR